MKPVAWISENKNVKGNWYLTWTEPPDGFNKRPLYEHSPEADAEIATLREQVTELQGQVGLLLRISKALAATEQKP